MTLPFADIAPAVWTTPGAMLTYAILLLVIGLTWLGVWLAYRNGSGGRHQATRARPGGVAGEETIPTETPAANDTTPAA